MIFTWEGGATLPASYSSPEISLSPSLSSSESSWRACGSWVLCGGAGGIVSTGSDLGVDRDLISASVLPVGVTDPPLSVISCSSSSST